MACVCSKGNADRRVLWLSVVFLYVSHGLWCSFSEVINYSKLKMKILGFASKVVKCIFNTVEAYMPEIKADSFEDYEKKYSEQVVSIVKESLPFFRIENDFDIVLMVALPPADATPDRTTSLY